MHRRTYDYNVILHIKLKLGVWWMFLLDQAPDKHFCVKYVWYCAWCYARGLHSVPCFCRTWKTEILDACNRHWAYQIERKRFYAWASYFGRKNPNKLRGNRKRKHTTNAMHCYYKIERLPSFEKIHRDNCFYTCTHMTYQQSPHIKFVSRINTWKNRKKIIEYQSIWNSTWIHNTIILNS